MMPYDVPLSLLVCVSVLMAAFVLIAVLLVISETSRRMAENEALRLRHIAESRGQQIESLQAECEHLTDRLHQRDLFLAGLMKVSRGEPLERLCERASAN